MVKKYLQQGEKMCKNAIKRAEIGDFIDFKDEKKPRVLFVNPPVYDFSVYDFWLKPYGLLRIAGYMRDKVEITYFDFMDRHSAYLKEEEKIPDRDAFGRGSYFAQPAKKPPEYEFIKDKHYRRFGVPQERFIDLLQTKQFDFVLITSAMTYWYLGIREVVENVRKIQPQAKIILGGIYATLCYEHAKSLGVDFVIKGNLQSGDSQSVQNLQMFEELFQVKLDFSEPPYWEGYTELPYGILKLNDGCPLNCSYCSVKKFYPNFSHRFSVNIQREYEFLLKKNIRNIAFYDDALLVDGEKILFPFLQMARELKPDILFHAPNAMHIKLINDEVAKKLKSFGFKKIFLGFESSSFRWQKETGGISGDKTNTEQFKNAIATLKNAGFQGSDLTAYVMLGHPKQDVQEVIDSVNFVASCGACSMLAEYSPIPSTPDGELCSKYVDLSEPLFHNSSVFPLFSFGKEKVQKVKDLVRELNKKLR